MDPPLINATSAYTLSEIWPLGGGERDGSVEESTVTEQSGGGGGRKRVWRDFSSEDESFKVLSSSTCSANELNESNGKRVKPSGPGNETGSSKAEESSAANNISTGQNNKPSEPPKQDYIHVRARRGQATDNHSLAERARREKISERMKILQDLVPSCNKVIGKALVLDEIINYVQSLQRQVEFLSMKLEAVNSGTNWSPAIEGFHPKDLGIPPFDATGMILGTQATREYVQGWQPEWRHTQVGEKL